MQFKILNSNQNIFWYSAEYQNDLVKAKNFFP